MTAVFRQFGKRVARIRRRTVLVSCVLVGTLSPLAQAQPVEAETTAVSRAREYFRAGAQAYSVGEYATAVQAFEQAYALAPRPAVLFSIAQAEKRQFFATQKREHLEKSIQSYRRYLEAEPQAARKGDAVQALAELEPLLRPASATTDTPVPSVNPSAPETATPTRLMLTSPAEGAKLSLDGAAEQSSPLIREVPPGEHVVRISAPGYVTDERRIVAVEGALATFDIVLTEQPAKLLVVCPEGAALSVDGRLQGTCPFPRPLELSPGEHLVTFTDSGYVTWSSERKLERGKTTTVVARMPRTVQRTSALILFGAAASAITTSGILTYFTLEQEASAKSFLAERGNSALSATNLEEYSSIRSDRDRLRLATLTTAGIGVGLAALGAFLFNYDSSTPRTSAKTAATLAPLGRNPSERFPLANLGAAPELSPGFTGLRLTGAF
jgi:tetratricopeptide (TPR) repeat protein